MQELYAIYGFYRFHPMCFLSLLSQDEQARFTELFNRPLNTEDASFYKM